MPTYDGQIRNKKLTFLRPDLYGKWARRNVGSWFRAKFEILGKHKDPKTAEQLGYYWACLLPEITKQFIDDGHTMTIKAYGLEREIPINEDGAHQWITDLCGDVGNNGKHLRLSECGKDETIRFIDNVLVFAIKNLRMNEETLKAQRPV